MILKISNLFKEKIILEIILIFFILTLLPLKGYSAELLQINDSKTILVGDQNRALTINLYCTYIDEKDEKKAIDLLKKNFPRGTKVKIKPYGYKNNNLLAKIYKIDNDLEMTNLLISSLLGIDNCNN